jgi:Fic family protein
MKRSGEYVKATGEVYLTFNPTKLPPTPPLVYDEEMLFLLGEANRKLAKLDGFSLQNVDIELFNYSYIRLEALLSSQIEGTHSSLIEIFDPNLEKNITADTFDVINYISALEFAWQRVSEFPLDGDLLRQTHQKLLKNTRGSNKSPGQYRDRQNWIGSNRGGQTIIRFTPPEVKVMVESMNNLEEFISSKDNLDPLVKAALIHYQFETIHPFLDGNGRLGRMLIILYLKKVNLLTNPILYISYFLKNFKAEYYNRLTRVRENGEYEGWIKFFLQAIIIGADDSLISLNALQSLYLKCQNLILNSGKLANDLLSFIQHHPIINLKSVVAKTNYSYSGISQAIKEFVKLGILKPFSDKKRNKLYIFDEFINILQVGVQENEYHVG